jgi:hypothetical protein
MVINKSSKLITYGGSLAEREGYERPPITPDTQPVLALADFVSTRLVTPFTVDRLEPLPANAIGSLPKQTLSDRADF